MPLRKTIQWTSAVFADDCLKRADWDGEFSGYRGRRQLPVLNETSPLKKMLDFDRQ
jgi:hypothetical protein